MAENLYSKKETFLHSIDEHSEIDLTSKSLAYDDLFFTKLMAASFCLQDIDIKEHFISVIYLTGMLENYARKSTGYMDLDPHVSDLVTKIKTNGNNSRELKISFADNVLFFNGLYPETFKKSAVKPSFYMSIASSLYIDVCDFQQEVYFTLGHNMNKYLTILRQTKEIIKQMEPDPDEKFLISLNELN